MATKYTAEDCINDIALFLDERNKGKRTDAQTFMTIQSAIQAFNKPVSDEEE